MKKRSRWESIILLAVVFTLGIGIGSLKAEETREKRKMEAGKGQRINKDGSNLPPELRKFYSPRVEQKENINRAKLKSSNFSRRASCNRAKPMLKLEGIEKAPKKMIDASAEIDVSETLLRKSLVEVKTFEPAKKMPALSGNVNKFTPQKAKALGAGSISRVKTFRRENQADIEVLQR